MAIEDLPIRFIVDDMLGKLAKWLRILGYDTIYHTFMPDADLLAMATRERRTLLTRDTELLKREAIGPHLFIEYDAPKQQLRQVVQALHLDTKRFLFSRCLICNERIVPVDREKVADRVPAYTYATQEGFSQCPTCGRIYWAGTHHQKAREWLADVEQVFGERMSVER